MTLDAIIVTLAGGFTVVFVAAWLVAPDLRAWLEAPKYGFQSAVRRYDRACRVEQGVGPREAQAERTTTS